MKQLTETKLPGVGVRHDFATKAGQTVGVISYHGGSRDIVVYDADDPDQCKTAMHLTEEEALTLETALGGSQVVSALDAVEQLIDGLVIEWIPISNNSPYVGRAIGDGEFRTTLGASIVAVIRGDETISAPRSDFVIEDGDCAIAVGTKDSLDALTVVLEGT